MNKFFYILLLTLILPLSAQAKKEVDFNTIYKKYKKEKSAESEQLPSVIFKQIRWGNNAEIKIKINDKEITLEEAEIALYRDAYMNPSEVENEVQNMGVKTYLDFETTQAIANLIFHLKSMYILNLGNCSEEVKSRFSKDISELNPNCYQTISAEIEIEEGEDEDKGENVILSCIFKHNKNSEIVQMVMRVDGAPFLIICNTKPISKEYSELIISKFSEIVDQIKSFSEN